MDGRREASLGAQLFFLYRQSRSRSCARACPPDPIVPSFSPPVHPPPSAQVRAAVAAIAPDVLLLELCRDRVGLLLPPDRGPSVWHAPRVELTGAPREADGWPPAAALLAACRAAPGVPVTTADIEADCVALQATGLFARVRFKTTMPPRSAGPQFLRRRAGVGGSAGSASPPSALQPAVPLGRIRFTAVPRELPPLASLGVRLDSALADAGWTLAPAKAVESAAGAVVADAASRNAAGRPGATVGALVAALPALRALATPPPGETGAAVSISYAGVESGAVEAVARPLAAAAAAAAADPAVLKPCGSGAPETGLEASAEGGAGPGIEPFIPYRGPLPLTPTMRVDNLAAVLDVDLDPVDAVVAAGTGPAAAAGVGEAGAGGGAGFVGRWPLPAVTAKAAGEGEGEEAEEDGPGDDLSEVADSEEANPGDDASSPPDPTALPEPSAFMGAAAQLLTSEYARRQSAAGAKVGLVEGAAWRAALEAADAGARPGTIVLLGDVPARLTAARLAGGVVGAAPLAVAAVAGAVARTRGLRLAAQVKGGARLRVGEHVLRLLEQGLHGGEILRVAAMGEADIEVA